MKLIFPNCDSIVAETPIYADGTVAWDRAEAWVYEPGSFRPLAKLQGEDLYYVVTDHIGTPRELISEDGTRTAWRARLGLWGETEALTRRAANDNTAPDCPIRFQGQWFDEESGLHYNRFRYYDPEAGQYLSRDPIGLAGGTRPQGYVADPNGWVDPLGLNTCSDNAAILGNNMAREGRAPAPGQAAAHIVASTGSKGHWAPAARSRDLLAKYDIGINDAANGIPLGHPRPHNVTHTRDFHTQVEQRLLGVEQRMQQQGYGHRATRSALRRELRAIGNEVLSAVGP